MREIGAVLLAAGASFRLGRPKQLLELNGKRLIDHVLDKILETKIHHTVVVTGAHHNEIAPILPSWVHIEYNENWQRGMGNSIAAGVSCLQARCADLSGIVIILSDQPLVNASHLKRLVSSIGTNAEDVVATEYEDGPGVPAVFASHTFQDLMQLTGDKGAKSLLRYKFLKVKIIKPDFSLADIDTEGDLQKMLSL